MKIGLKLRRLRESCDYSQEFLAGRLAISTSQYSKYERDETSITIDRLEKIAGVYGISVVDILGIKERFFPGDDSIQSDCRTTSTSEPILILIDELRREIEVLKAQNNLLFKSINSKQ